MSACGQAPVEESADKSGPTWQEQYDLGVRYLSEGNYEEAIIAFTAAIEIDPKQAPAYMGRGDAYIRSGETEENLLAAQTDYEMAIELDDKLAEAYLGLADVYISQGNTEKALEILRKGLSATGDDPSIAGRILEFEGSNAYADKECEMAVLLRKGDGGNLLTAEDVSFFGHDYHTLTVEQAEAILKENGFYTSDGGDGHEDEVIGGKETDYGLILFPAVILEPTSGGGITWSHFSGNQKSLNTGIRDICTEDSLETVLNKIGFTTAPDITRVLNDYYQESTQNETINEKNFKDEIDNWKYWNEIEDTHYEWFATYRFTGPTLEESRIVDFRVTCPSVRLDFRFNDNHFSSLHCVVR